jgi:hypothetical protein
MGVVIGMIGWPMTSARGCIGGIVAGIPWAHVITAPTCNMNPGIACSFRGLPK